ncbi:Piso0_000452 [Millerozyma farinosa CBS 7064]|uniref:Piso0_000452 protein n=1 Tax=Pichia sorbitophila (strain ATCC MYA-4447 / BCRC 22081 / CBS 7064 / NBRC 10061 / NRRL Y-12695) TaxID=559304 RepID=G8YU13_PICSO|nr:Piso0_000452 [Millerozyma farinosa CBS 7064]CCE73414.1 Piso0_000452 [Millerozyma farinosa CBS 7064]
MIGKAVHIGVDLAIVSAFLAAVKRNTGLAPDFNQIQNETARYYGSKYLDLGESMFDYSVAALSSSGYFKRK